MVRTEKQGCKDNISVWKGGHRHTPHLLRITQMPKALHWYSQKKLKSIKVWGCNKWSHPGIVELYYYSD